MSVLKGELAVKQNIELIRIFKSMKDYIFESKIEILIRRFFKIMNLHKHKTTTSTRL